MEHVYKIGNAQTSTTIHQKHEEKEKEENPQYQKLYRKIGNLEVKLKQQIQSNKLLTRDVKQAESKLEIASTEAKKEQQKAASFRDKMKKMEGEEATGERTLEGGDKTA